MNFSSYLLLLLVGVAFAATAAEDACPPSEVMKFAELYTNPHVRPCQEVSAGFSIAPPNGYPTEPQVKAMCAAEACRLLIKDVLALKPNDCFLTFAGAKLNAYKLATSFEDACKPEKSSEDHDDSCSTDKDGDEDHKDIKQYPTPSPTEGKHYPTPTPTDDKHYPTPKPTEGKPYPTPKPTKHVNYPTPKPTEHVNYPTPKPTRHFYPPTKPVDNEYPTPKPTDTKNYHMPVETKTVKGDPCCVSPPLKEADANDAAKLKPPMNGTAEDFHPMPNTTYKAEVNSSLLL